MNGSCRLCVFLWLISGAAFAWPESRMAQIISLGGIIENDAVRHELRYELAGPIREIKEGVFEYPPLHGGTSGRLHVFLKPNAVYFLFVNRTAAGFPETGKGNYLIKRSRSTGRFESVKIFYRDFLNREGECSLLVRPRGEESRLDVLLFGRTLHHDLPLPAPLDSLLTAPLSSLLEMTQGRVDWPRLLFQGGREEDRLMAAIVRAIEKELPAVREAADGALNNDGKFVTIADGRPQQGVPGLNCSGFAKWLIDGFHAPLAGGLIDIDRLKTKHPASRGNRWSELREDARDPYFGLDWSRNLAVILDEARTGATDRDIESCDVRLVPFFTYSEDSGYRISDLYHVLFFLAVARPGTAFLGAVNDIAASDPLQVGYYHVAAFFPFFDEQGRFQVAVMDQHKDRSIFRFIEGYPSARVHLVRFEIDSEFALFHIE